jgi:serine/threonine protein phosphatase PrpC
MRIRPGNAQHQGARDSQQDSFGFSHLEDRAFTAHAGCLGVVADGMGGMAHGGAASATAVQTVLHEYAAKRPHETIQDALERAVTRANEAVVAMAEAAGVPREVGTTLAAAVVHGAEMHWISVGDSRVYLCRRGRLTQVTVDHVYAAELDARLAEGEISADRAQTDPDRDALTSHLGQTTLGAVDRNVTPLPLLEGDRIVICSDGIYRALSPAEVAGPLAGAPQDACEKLVSHVVAKQLAKQDNMTVIVLALDASRS